MLIKVEEGGGVVVRSEGGRGAGRIVFAGNIIAYIIISSGEGALLVPNSCRLAFILLFKPSWIEQLIISFEDSIHPWKSWVNRIFGAIMLL